MNYYQFMNNLDAQFKGFSLKSEAMFGRIISAIKWSWDKMTLLSVLIIVMIIAICGLTWLILSDNKKLASRAYWRGYEARKKEED